MDRILPEPMVEPDLPAPQPQPAAGGPERTADWEAFYANYRQPGYLPGFAIGGKLGGGAFGLVYKATRQSIGKDYAIKFLKVDDTEVRRAVLLELEQVKYFAQVDHPNLVSIEDRGEVDGIPFIVMAYAGAETLKDRLPGDAITRPELLRWFLQACRGVAALHERSLVHFDLKPANVFLKGGVARVGDYGLSKLVTHSRASLSMGRGTPYYMAPEMLQRRGDARSDIYSLGVMLFEIVCGDVPFKGDSEWEVLKKHETAAVSFPAGMGDIERRVIARCLAKLPDERFASVAELLHALDAPASLGESLVLPPLRPAAAPGPSSAPLPPPLPSAPREVAAESPYGMPWQGSDPAPVGFLGGVVHAIFRLFEFTVFLALLPVRAISVVLGRGVTALVKLPFQILGLSLQLFGYLVVAVALLLVLVSVISLLVR